MTKRAWIILLFTTTIALLLWMIMLCTSGPRVTGGPSASTTELRPHWGLEAAPFAVESFAPGLQILAAAAGDDSSVVEPGNDTTATAGKTASPSDQLVIPESYDRRLLVAQRDCTCACTLPCDNEPPTFNMSMSAVPAARRLLVDAEVPTASPTAKKGACGGEAGKSAIDGAFSGLAANLLACVTACKSSRVSWCFSIKDRLSKSCLTFCMVFMTGLSSALGVASGCARAAVNG